jgi:DNA polymerase-1
MQTQRILFSTQKTTESIPTINWELPNLAGHNVPLGFDTETTGLRLWKGDRPVGLSIAVPEGQAWYIPFAHEQGFNYSLDTVKLWIKDNLRGKELISSNGKFDYNMMFSIGIDLEELDVTLRDAQHLPALLDSNRQSLSLEDMSIKFLGRGKKEMDDKNNIHKRNSAHVAEYAQEDARLPLELHLALTPLIEKEDLTTVRNLEDNLIFCVGSMERQGVRIDINKVLVWQKIIQSRYIKLVMELYRLTGCRIEPTKPVHLEKLYRVLGIEHGFTATGKGSFPVEEMMQYANIPAVRCAIEAKQLRSFESKFINPILNKTGSDGKLRYVLNQLKATEEEASVGAITGRFSSSGGGKAIDGINIQQVFDNEKQEKIPAIADFPIRDVFLPEEGFHWISADARQIEFRIFAHYSKSPRLLKAYEENPLIDFHAYVAETIFHVPRDKKLKNMNFGKLYGVGVEKLANVYLKCSYEEAQVMVNHYDKEFPEPKELMRKAIDLAKSTGYVKTMLGRRRRYGPSDMKYNARSGKKEIPYWSSLPAIISGTAADLMKMKLLRLHQTRKETGFTQYFTVHDETDGQVPDVESARKVDEILQEQELELRVPILWDVGIGESWMRLENIDDFGKELDF